MRSSRCSILPLWMQRRFELDAPQQATRISPTLGLESQAPRARKLLPPRTTPFKWARRIPTHFRVSNGETRRSKERSKSKRDVLSRARTTRRSLRLEVRSLCSFEPLLSSAMRASWDGIPFACLYTFASWTEAFVQIVLPRRRTPFRKPRCFSPWESNDRRDRSLNHPTGPFRDATGSRFCHAECPRLFFPKILAWG
jgi:hypothetical protein